MTARGQGSWSVYMYTIPYQALTGTCSRKISSPALCPTSRADTMVSSDLRKPLCDKVQRLAEIRQGGTKVTGRGGLGGAPVAPATNRS